VERGEDEDGRLPHTGLGLADDVHAQDGLGDAFVLHYERRGGREGKSYSFSQPSSLPHSLHSPS
jgi:hypothetical protein